MKQPPHRRGVELSPGTRREIISLHKGGLKFGDIEKELGVKANTAGNGETMGITVNRLLAPVDPRNSMRTAFSNYKLM